MPGIILVIDRTSLEREALLTQLKRAVSSNLDVIKLDTLSDAEALLSTRTQVIFIDIFAFPVEQSIRFVGGVRNAYPWIAFVLYVRHSDLQYHEGELPEEWQRRFGHYYKVFKDFAASRQFRDMVQSALTRGLKWVNYMGAPTEPTEDDRDDSLTKKTDVSDAQATPQAVQDASLSTRAFICYAREDAMFVDWLWQEVEARGHGVWLDRKDIKPGDIWDDKIDEALNNCPVMLLVLSPAALASKNVATEWKFFIKLGKIIIPVLWQDCQLHYRLVNLQHIDFRDYRRDGLDELTERLDQIIPSQD